jgi:hypothetical protein
MDALSHAPGKPTQNWNTQIHIQRYGTKRRGCLLVS